MKEEYKNKMIDKSRYSIVDINDIKLTEEEIKDNNYVFLPYICVEYSDNSKQYDEFMEEYYKQHECCPKCGQEEHSSTLVGYVFDHNKKDEYKDMNRCECMNCGDNHSIHDRICSSEIYNCDDLKKRTNECSECDIMANYEDPDKWYGVKNCPMCGKDTEILRTSWF